MILAYLREWNKNEFIPKILPWKAMLMVKNAKS